MLWVNLFLEIKRNPIEAITEGAIGELSGQSDIEEIKSILRKLVKQTVKRYVEKIETIKPIRVKDRSRFIYEMETLGISVRFKNEGRRSDRVFIPIKNVYTLSFYAITISVIAMQLFTFKAIEK